jgi:hypothetical protein
MRHLAGLLPGLLPSALFARTPRANELIAPKPRGRAVRMLASNGTFNVGRNAEKREAREHQATSRRRAVTEYMLGYKKFRPAKTNSSRVVKMLSDRRLRQTRGGL